MAKQREPRPTRRGVLQTGAAAALGGVLGTEPLAAETGMPGIYQSLGVKPVINALGTVTFLGGSLMPPEVIAAWVEAAKHFVNISDLHDRVGERLAKVIGVEAALVTTGAAGALLLATAAAVTRGDAQAIKKLPATSGLRNEVILQKSHHSCYDNQLTNVGVKLVEVETAADLRKALSERTALMFFMNINDGDGKIKRAQWIELARAAKVPTLLDAAADVPPLERLAGYNAQGFDLVAFSGGKAIRGPNNTGLLLGRKDLIAAAKLNASPHCGTIGRMMKVSKEAMVALLAAVERFVKLDHAAERREFERRISVIELAVKDIATVTTERITPAIANHVPHLLLHWDEARLQLTPVGLAKALFEGDPPIQIGRIGGTGDKGAMISVLTLAAGEEVIVARRVQAILRAASGN